MHKIAQIKRCKANRTKSKRGAQVFNLNGVECALEEKRANEVVAVKRAN